MRTEPSGKQARISSVPPMASINLVSVLTYMPDWRSIFETVACLMPKVSARRSWVNSRAVRSSSRAMSCRVSLTRASTRARDSAGSRFRSSLKFLAFAMVISLPVRAGAVRRGGPPEARRFHTTVRSRSCRLRSAARRSAGGQRRTEPGRAGRGADAQLVRVGVAASGNIPNYAYSSA